MRYNYKTLAMGLILSLLVLLNTGRFFHPRIKKTAQTYNPLLINTLINFLYRCLSTYYYLDNPSLFIKFIGFLTYVRMYVAGFNLACVVRPNLVPTISESLLL